VRIKNCFILFYCVVFSWTCVYPFDVVKTTIQTRNVSVAGSGQPPCQPVQGIFPVAKSLYNQHGINVFYRGLGTTVMRAFLVNGIIFLGYEHLKSTFGLV